MSGAVIGRSLGSMLAHTGALALAGCGGGSGSDDSPPPATSAVPPSASESVGGFIAYLKELVVTSADTLEPVDINAVTPPTSESTEPEAVD